MDQVTVDIDQPEGVADVPVTVNDKEVQEIISEGPKEKVTEEGTVKVNMAEMQLILDRNSISPHTFVNSLPDSVKRRVNALKKLQLDYFNLEAKFFQELHNLECIYEQLYSPLFSRRADIVGAVVEPTEEESSWTNDNEEEDKKTPGATGAGTGSNALDSHDSVPVVEPSLTDITVLMGEDLIVSETSDESNKPAADASPSTDGFRGIPGFWLRIFTNVDILAAHTQDDDKPILRSLKDIRVVVEENSMPPVWQFCSLPHSMLNTPWSIKTFSMPESVEHIQFRLEFLFEPNDYFSNSVLTKDYEMRFEPDKGMPLLYDGPDIVKCHGCTIDWKPGKNVTEKEVTKVQRHKTKGTKKTVTKTVKADSFFNFFNPPEVPEGEEPSEEVEETLSSDFEIGHFIRNQVIPRAVLYFTGDALLDSDDEYERGVSDDTDHSVSPRHTSDEEDD